MSAYRLKRDDGTELPLKGGTWEAALELAYGSGWRPLGTEAPRSSAWRQRAATGSRTWAPNDYFSPEAQRVVSDDALALAEAVSRALQRIADLHEVRAASADPMPSGAAGLGELSESKRKAMLRLVGFARRGGFSIDSEL